MTRKRLLLLGLAVTLLTFGPPRDSSAKTRRLRCSQIRVSSPDVTRNKKGKKGKKSKTERFSASQILDLELEVRLPTKQFREQHMGRHKVALKLYTPSGSLYQTLVLPFVVDTPEATNEARYLSASTTFPVAGTSIVTSSLYGRWTILGYVDGDTKRCGKAKRIKLNP